MDRQELDRIATALVEHQALPCADETGPLNLPNREAVGDLCRRFLAILFPGFFTRTHLFCGHVGTYTRQQLLELWQILRQLICEAETFSRHAQGLPVPAHLQSATDELLSTYFAELPAIAGLISTDVEAAFANDPAANSREEIVASYPGLSSIAVQRLAHQLYRLGVPLIPRMMTEDAHSRTGIDIHPGACIDESFAIDHGTGIVIGETCTIGKHCMLYHGVTLGAFNPLAKNDAGELTRGAANKRHPDLEDSVRVYPGATILGGSTRVGHHSVIGGNVWLTHSVAPHSKVTMKDPELQVSTARTSKQETPDWSI